LQAKGGDFGVALFRPTQEERLGHVGPLLKARHAIN
jgi:hypothetical protein